MNYIDAGGCHSRFLDGIVDHSINSYVVVSNDNRWVVTKHGGRKVIYTTIGWKFKVRCKDGTTRWIPLKKLTESKPVKIAEYDKAGDI